jgi:hypothetical protein
VWQSNAVLALASAVVLTLAAGCSPPNDLSNSPLAVQAGGWNGNDAALAGMLVEEDGCVVVLAENDREGQRMLIAFAEDGLEWDDSRDILTVYGHEYRLQERVRLGGSERARDLVGDPTWKHAPSAGCRYDGIWGLNPPQQDRP